MSWSDAWAIGPLMWKNAVALGETAVASEAVIRHRTTSPDLAEMGRMVPEKVDAFSRAGASLMGDWFAIQQDCFLQMQDLTQLALSGRPPSAAATRRISDRAARIVGQASRAGGRALAPIHKAATANDRRLRKRPTAPK